MEFKYLKISEIVENEYNANVMNDEAFDRLVREIKSTGFVAPIIVRPKDGYYIVIDGEHRLKAARFLNYEEIPCIIVDDDRFNDEEFAKLVSLRLNVLRGKIDPIKFINYYNEFLEKYGVEAVREVIGFTDDVAWKHLSSEVSKILSTASGLPKEATEKAKRKVKKARTLDQLADILSEVYENYANLQDKGLLIFSFGGVEAVYFLVDKDVFEEVRDMSKYIETSGVDVSVFFRRIFAGWQDFVGDDDKPF